MFHSKNEEEKPKGVLIQETELERMLRNRDLPFSEKLSRFTAMIRRNRLLKEMSDKNSKKAINRKWMY